MKTIALVAALLLLVGCAPRKAVEVNRVVPVEWQTIPCDQDNCGKAVR